MFDFSVQERSRKQNVVSKPLAVSSQTLFSSVLLDLAVLDLVCSGMEKFEFHDQIHQGRSFFEPIHTYPRTHAHAHMHTQSSHFNLHNCNFGIMHWSIPIDELIFCNYEAMYIDLEITNKSKRIYLGLKNEKSGLQITISNLSC